MEISITGTIKITEFFSLEGEEIENPESIIEKIKTEEYIISLSTKQIFTSGLVPVCEFLYTTCPDMDYTFPKTK